MRLWGIERETLWSSFILKPRNSFSVNDRSVNTWIVNTLNEEWRGERSWINKSARRVLCSQCLAYKQISKVIINILIDDLWVWQLWTQLKWEREKQRTSQRATPSPQTMALPFPSLYHSLSLFFCSLSITLSLIFSFFYSLFSFFFSLVLAFSLSPCKVSPKVSSNFLKPFSFHSRRASFIFASISCRKKEVRKKSFENYGWRHLWLLPRMLNILALWNSYRKTVHIINNKKQYIGTYITNHFKMETLWVRLKQKDSSEGFWPQAKKVKINKWLYKKKLALFEACNLNDLFAQSAHIELSWRNT